MTRALPPPDIDTLPVIPAARSPRCPLTPPAEFADWRDNPGLQRARWQGKQVWMISRHEDIRAALVDPRLSANTMAYATAVSDQTESPAQVFARLDDPEHHRLRRMMAGQFTFRRAEALRPQFQAIADRYLDEMIAAGPPADLVRSFALPVPSMVICHLLGVPYEDHDFFQEQSGAGQDATDPERQAAAQLALFGYMFELVERKEREPGDDLMSRLVTDHVLTGELTRETAAMNGVVLLAAGHETTASMISLGTLALLQHPEQSVRLRESGDPAVAAAIVEELLRYLTIVHSMIDRVAVEDLTIGGQLVRAGETVLMNLPAGNFDPEFLERPGDFDPGRSVRGHLSFGYGVHQCLGQHLARTELQVALPTLFRRLPDLALAAPADTLNFLNNKEIYGLQELPVTW